MFESSSTIPIITGFAIGIAFIVVFASIFTHVDFNFTKRHYLDLAIDGLKDNYHPGERIDFLAKAKGFEHLCGFPSLSIVDAQGAKKLGREMNLVSLMGGCDPDLRNIDETWTLQQMGILNDIAIQESGNYKVIIEYGDQWLVRTFTVE